LTVAFHDKLATAKRRANRLGTLRHHPPRPLRLPVDDRPGYPLEDPPTISIVTPSFNQAEFLEQTIESVLSQNYPSLEYVVQDGGSDDGSRQILERYSSRLHHWESALDDGHPRGQAANVNRGFARTSGEIMAYLNSDDLLLPGALHYVARYLQSHPEVDAVYGHRVLIDEAGMEIGRQVIPRHSDRVLVWADFIPQETLFWRRAVWERAGGAMDESFRYALDWDLLVRLREAGARMVRLPRFLGAFRVHGAQKTSTLAPTTGIEEMQRIRHRLHGRPVDQKEVLRRVRPYLIRHVVLDHLYRRGLLRY
jgi:glycosyltransferase involved in cell wall biosynthesis